MDIYLLWHEPLFAAAIVKAYHVLRLFATEVEAEQPAASDTLLGGDGTSHNLGIRIVKEGEWDDQACTSVSSSSARFMVAAMMISARLYPDFPRSVGI